MTDSELDQTYTALCNAIANVGESQTQSFLAMLSLSLIAHNPSSTQVLALIAQSQAQCQGAEIETNTNTKT